GTLQAWMTEEHLSLKAIGAFSIVTLPYSLKFLWSPFLDRFLSTIFTSFGRRRGWMLCCQLALLALISAIAFSHPGSEYNKLFLLAIALALASASQDVVIDAYRADLLPRGELGPGASAAIVGYRLGLLTSGAVALSLAEFFPWPNVYCLMA